MVEITASRPRPVRAPVNTRRSLLERTILDSRMRFAGRSRDERRHVATLAATRPRLGGARAERRRGPTGARLSRLQVLHRRSICHGRATSQSELNRLSKERRWTDMSALIDDEALETLSSASRTPSSQLRDASTGSATPGDHAQLRASTPTTGRRSLAALRTGASVVATATHHVRTSSAAFRNHAPRAVRSTDELLDIWAPRSSSHSSLPRRHAVFEVTSTTSWRSPSRGLGRYCARMR